MTFLAAKSFGAYKCLLVVPFIFLKGCQGGFLKQIYTLSVTSEWFICMIGPVTTPNSGRKGITAYCVSSAIDVAGKFYENQMKFL